MAFFLVTGGAGFIGSNIVAELLKRGERVRVLDNFATGLRENLIPFNGKIEVVEGSLTDLETVRQSVRGVDYVLHQGALPSIPRSIEQPINSNNVNVSGTLNVLVASKDEGIKKIVLASSSSVYGNTEEMPKKEVMVPKPLTPYAVSKLTCEQYARVFWEIYQLPTVALRYFNVFGPKQNPNSQYSAVIPKFIKAMMEGKRPVIYGDGTQSRDFSFVDNVVEANLLAAQSKDAKGVVMNIACQKAYSLLDLVRGLNLIMNSHIDPIFEKARMGDVKHSLADISLARQLIKYEPMVSWEDGLKKTVQWHLEMRKNIIH